MFNNKAKRPHLRNTNLCRVGVSPSTGIIPQKNYEKQAKIRLLAYRTFRLKAVYSSDEILNTNLK